MIATFFEWRIEPGNEAEFRSAWAEVTKRLRAHGSHGSTLFRRSEGHYCGLARWPDAATRDAAFAAEKGSDAGQRMQRIVSATIQRFDLDELDNLWTR